MPKVPVLIACALFAFLVACDQESEDKRTLIESCEETLVKRLKSPSSYKRINDPEVRLDTKAISDSEFEALMANEDPFDAELYRGMRAARRGYVDVSRYVATIEYDAANSYGALIRDTASCRSGMSYFGAPDGLSLSSNTLVEVDGKTSHDWTLERVRKTLENYERIRNATNERQRSQ